MVLYLTDIHSSALVNSADPKQFSVELYRSTLLYGQSYDTQWYHPIGCLAHQKVTVTVSLKLHVDHMTYKYISSCSVLCCPPRPSQTSGGNYNTFGDDIDPRE